MRKNRESEQRIREQSSRARALKNGPPTSLDSVVKLRNGGSRLQQSLEEGAKGRTGREELSEMLIDQGTTKLPQLRTNRGSGVGIYQT